MAEATVLPIRGGFIGPEGNTVAEHCLAAIDIGTNSIHMVVVEIQPALSAFRILTREKDTVRLGECDPHTGKLTDAAIARSLAALQRCRELATSFRAEQIVAVATSAVREAPNGNTFIRRVAEEVGIEVALISGQEEARRIYLGVLSAMEFGSQPHIIIDVGGGSTELIVGDGDDPRFLSSTKVGAVRLTREFLSADPPVASELDALRAHIRGMFGRATAGALATLEPGEMPRLVATSGTAECLATWHATETLGTVPNPLQGYRVSRRDLANLAERLVKLDRDERAALPGVGTRRAEIVVAGAIILQEALSLLRADELVVCERALREGVIVDWMLARGTIESRLHYHQSVRERSTLKLARKYGVDLDHGRRVAAFAGVLFDRLQGQLHDWGSAEKSLLWVAAILHNCGIYVSHAAHHKHSYYLIRHGELLGFTEMEIETIANIARYHRKSKPKKKHEHYQNLPEYLRVRVDRLSAMLRIAVALDRRQVGAIARLECQYFPKDKRLELALLPRDLGDRCTLELWNLAEKKLAFEGEFGVEVVASVVPQVEVAQAPAVGAHGGNPEHLPQP